MKDLGSKTQVGTGAVRWLSSELVFAAKPDNLKSIPRTHKVKERNKAHKISSDMHMRHGESS